MGAGSRVVYCDHNATTPLRAEVAARFESLLRGTWGNPSSVHAAGRDARRVLGDARDQLAAALGADARELTFTSGGTESINAALTGVFRARRDRGRHVVVTAVEHSATRRCVAALAQREGAEVTTVAVDARGWWSAEAVLAALRDDTALVTVLHANNETGVLYDVAPLAAACRARGVALHLDAVQSLGKVPLDLRALGVDLASFSAHKLGAPKGSGALYVRRGVRVESLLHGGPQERGRRPGTENVAAHAAFALAAELAARDCEPEALRLAALRDALERQLLARWPGARVNGAGAPRLSNTTSIAFPGLDGALLVARLDLLGVQASTGAACSQADEGPSHVLTAMGLSAAEASSSLRFSLGAGNTAEDLPHIAAAFARAAPDATAPP